MKLKEAKIINYEENFFKRKLIEASYILLANKPLSKPSIPISKSSTKPKNILAMKQPCTHHSIEMTHRGTTGNGDSDYLVSVPLSLVKRKRVVCAIEYCAEVLTGRWLEQSGPYFGCRKRNRPYSAKNFKHNTIDEDRVRKAEKAGEEETKQARKRARMVRKKLIDDDKAKEQEYEAGMF
ncbi:hypothetical protein J6590_077790 [Homalodisca vitripennis]|nr:hypothetical protein J6590_077790 [Homalodisca vitripennis]